MESFEITIQRASQALWPVVAEYPAPDHGMPVRCEGTLPPFDPAALAGADLAGYGRILGEAIFTGPLRDAFAECLGRVGRMRVLLYVEEPALRALRWERLCAPVDGDWPMLARTQRLPFSHYLPSLTDRRYPPIGRSDLKALVLAASPAGLSDYGLAHFDIAASVAGVRAALDPIPATVLADLPDAAGPPTLNALCAQITANPYTLLHVICHGRVIGDGETVIYLASPDDQHKVHAIPATDLLARLSALEGYGLPHMTFLATCESASPEASGALGSLAQRMVSQLGMPAVVAMTDTISIATATGLANAFYRLLREHGEPDRALVEATAGLQEQSDITVPVIYSRLGGRPLFADSVERPLRDDELEVGITRLRPLLEERAPTLLPEFDTAVQTLRSAAGVAPASMSPERRAEHAAALQQIATICVDATEMSLHALALGLQAPPAYDSRCPFPGLRAFQSEQREFFFGREAAIERLTERLATEGLLALIGHSGSGKSSLTLAGLLPELQRRRPGLRAAVFAPGFLPLASLDLALYEAERQGEPDAPILVVIDQLEELFTVCTDEEERAAFVEALQRLPQRHGLLLTMGTDFWEACAAYPTLRSLLEPHLAPIEPLTAEELRRAMERQAALVGLRFEANLGTRIIDDVRNEPGAMPLLQHALRELWLRRRGRWLRFDAYEQIGGVQRALAHSADAIYTAHQPESRERLRDLFLRLTRLDPNHEEGETWRDSIQRVPLDDLVPAGEAPETTRALVAELAEARLLVVTGPSVELAHEALIRSWPRLRDWLATDRQSLLQRELLRQAAIAWEQSKGNESFLWSGRRLAQAEALAELPRVPLNAREQSFLDASRALHARQEQAAAEQLAREKRLREEAEARRAEAEQARERAVQSQQEAEQARERARARARTLAWVSLAAAAFFVAAALAAYLAAFQAGVAASNAQVARTQAVLAQSQRDEARRQEALALTAESRAEAQRATAEAERTRAEASAAEARSRALVAGAQAALSREDPDEALALALDADQRQAALVLAEAADASARLSLGPFDTPVSVVAFSPDGNTFLAGTEGGELTVWDRASGELRRRFTAPGAITSAAYSPDSTRIVVGTADGVLLELGAAEGLRFAPTAGGAITQLTVSPDGSQVLSGGEDGAATLWNLATRRAQGDLRPAGGQPVAGVAFLLDGGALVVGGDGTAQRLTLGGSAIDSFVLRDPTGPGMGDDGLPPPCLVTAMTMLPDGQSLVAGCSDGALLHWSLAEGWLGTLCCHDSNVLAVTASRDGAHVASSGFDNTRLWELASGVQVWSYAGHEGEVNSLAISRRGEVLTGSFDGTARLWDLRGGQRLADLALPDGASLEMVLGLAFGPGGELLVVDNFGTLGRWPGSGSARPTASQLPGFPLAFSTDGSLAVLFVDDTSAVGQGRSGTGELLLLWDVGAGEPRCALPGGVGNFQTAAFSPGSNQVAVASAGSLLLVGSQARPDGDCAPVRRLTGDGGVIRSIALSADGALAVTGSEDGLVRLWDAAAGSLVAELPGHRDIVTSVALSPDGTMLASGSWDRSVRLWDTAQRRELAVLRGHTQAVQALAFSADGRLLASGSNDRSARLWDLASRQELARFAEHQSAVIQVAFSPNARTLAAGTETGELVLWLALRPEELTDWVREHRTVPGA